MGADDAVRPVGNLIQRKRHTHRRNGDRERAGKSDYNFADAQAINFEWVGLVGSVLAPRATVQGGVGVITGNVVANAWDSGIQVNTGRYFEAIDWPV